MTRGARLLLVAGAGALTVFAIALLLAGSDDESNLTIRQTVSGVAFVSFLIGGFVLFARLLDRYMRYRLFGSGDAPRALVRDLIFWATLMVLLTFPALALLFGVPAGEFLWWVLLRTAAGWVALGTMLYYEFFIVGSDPDPEVRAAECRAQGYMQAVADIRHAIASDATVEWPAQITLILDAAMPRPATAAALTKGKVNQ